MKDNSLVDSNILTYAYDADEKVKRPVAKKILEKIFMKELDACFSTQNLSEFYVVATGKIENPISPNEVNEIISDLISLTNVHLFIIRFQTIIKAIIISEEYKVHYWDALIAAVMQENNINTIVTENEKDFKKIPFIKVINPFYG